MAKELDVYRDWLGITETARPLNCYQLLRLKPFEDDPARIRNHYQKMNAHVRKFATGDYARQSQQLLDELARAMLCLSDAKRKREYDATLGRKDAGQRRRRSLEAILLARKTIDRDQLNKARNYAQAVGLDVRDALVQQKMAAADVVMLAYAESQGLPYVELEDVGVDERLISQIPPTLARQHSCVPLMIDGGQLLMACPNPLAPEVEKELGSRLNVPVRTVLCRAASVNAVIAEHYPREAAEPAAAPGKTTAKRKAERKPDREPLSQDEKLKRRLWISVIVFNVVVMLYMIFRVATYTGYMIDFPSFSAGSIAVLLGLLAGGATFAIITRKDR